MTTYCNIVALWQYPNILQVMDETEGWGDFWTGYGSENRKFLAASFPGTPWILALATLDDKAIASIATSQLESP